MAEVKHHLRKLEFSKAVVESLRQLSKMNVGSFETAAQARSYQTLMKEIVDEFVFWEVDRRNSRRKKLPAIKELYVLESICNHFHQLSVGAMHDDFFFVLFPPAPVMTENRCHSLVKLSSLVLAVRNSRILTYIGSWMQLSDCTHDVSIMIAKNLIQDYFKLGSSSINFLNDLPNISPLFCASLIISLAHLYSTLANPPPVQLVEIIAGWIRTTPSLCYSPLEVLSHMFGGSIKIQAPIPGLLLWCVLAPLRTDKDFDKNKELKIYSILHLALLETLLTAAKHRHRLPVYSMIDSKDIIHITHILKMCEQTPGADMQLALDYLAQALQVAVAMLCIQGNFPEMIDSLMPLPQNRILGILIKKWRGF